MERWRYPENWEDIAYKVKQDANWKCQRCDNPCRPTYLSISAWLAEEAIKLHDNGLSRETLLEFKEKEKHPHRWTLTVAHLDHDPENPHARLMAMCAPCHRQYDGKQAAITRASKRLQKMEALGQLTLPGVRE